MSKDAGRRVVAAGAGMASVASSPRVPAPAHSPAMQRILAVLQRKSEMSVADLAAEAFVGVAEVYGQGHV